MRTESLRELKRRRAPVVPDYWRPSTYADCLRLPRPCPYVGCRYHLMLEAKSSGSITYYFNDVSRMQHTCALDVANDGPKIAEHVARMLNVDEKRVRGVQSEALAKVAVLL